MIDVVLSGFLFLFIIVTNLLSGRFGYQSFNDLESELKLQKIAKSPKNFKTGFTFIVIEHFAIIGLVVMLFFVFSSYSTILAVIWTVSRSLEALIQIYYKKSYWTLLNLANQYSAASEAEKNSIIDCAQGLLKTKNSVFVSTQLLFSIGTFAYSILFATSSTGVPDLLGWFGIIASIIYGAGNTINIAKPNFKAIWNIGGLLIFIFELILGVWLLFSGFI